MKKRILIVVYALLLCVTICFAWLSNSRVNYVREINVDFKNGALTVDRAGVTGVIGTVDSKGEFKAVDKLSIDSRLMIPGSGHKFQIRLKNIDETKTQKIKLGVLIKLNDDTDVPQGTGELPDVFDKLYISVLKRATSSGEANNVEFDSDNSFSVKLNEASVYGNPDDKMYFLWICKDETEIILPAKESDSDASESLGNEVSPVAETETEADATQTTGPYDDYNITINCSLEFDPSATAQHQNIQIETLAFRVE